MIPTVDAEYYYSIEVENVITRHVASACKKFASCKKAGLHLKSDKPINSIFRLSSFALTPQKNRFLRSRL